MRLWHYKLIPFLPRQQLLGQHRECCALRGLGWGRKHKTVDYVFRHSYARLFFFHGLVINEMHRLDYDVNVNWGRIEWRGNRKDTLSESEKYRELYAYHRVSFDVRRGRPVYPEHDKNYLFECLVNLEEKGTDVLMRFMASEFAKDVKEEVEKMILGGRHV